MPLTLYYHPLASFCHKVLIALYENETEFEKRIIDLMAEADRAELQARWPIGKFPVLHDHTRQRDVAELPFPEDGGHLSAYFERLMQRPSVQRVIDEAKPYFQFYPFAQAIPLRFR